MLLKRIYPKIHLMSIEGEIWNDVINVERKMDMSFSLPQKLSLIKKAINYGKLHAIQKFKKECVIISYDKINSYPDRNRSR